MSKEARKLALEALKMNPLDTPTAVYDEKHNNAIKALEESLAKQEQGEPVGMVAKDGRTILFFDNEFQRIEPFTDVYTTPQQRKPQGYAGVTIWGGDATVTKCFTQIQIEQARSPRSLVEFAVQKCLNELSAHGIKE